jgi:peptide deformylase
MALRNLRYDGDEILRKKSRTVLDVTQSVETLLDDMHDTMNHYNGVGLAAPQVGILKRIIVIHDEDDTYELINPEIVQTDGKQTGDEGCLSLPGLIGTVERPEKVTVKYYDRGLNEQNLSVDGRLAVIIAHEADHLEGILYKDRAAPGTIRENTEEEPSNVRRRKKK